MTRFLRNGSRTAPKDRERVLQERSVSRPFLTVRGWAHPSCEFSGGGVMSQVYTSAIAYGEALGHRVDEDTTANPKKLEPNQRCARQTGICQKGARGNGLK